MIENAIYDEGISEYINYNDFYEPKSLQTLCAEELTKNLIYLDQKSPNLLNMFDENILNLNEIKIELNENNNENNEDLPSKTELQYLFHSLELLPIDIINTMLKTCQKSHYLSVSLFYFILQKSLNILNLSNNIKFHNINKSITPLHLKLILEKAPNIKKLNLSNNNLNGFLLSYLHASCVLLSENNSFLSQQISHNINENIIPYSNLIELNLSGCKSLYDPTLEAICYSFQTLEYLDISACFNLTIDGINYIINSIFKNNLKSLKLRALKCLNDETMNELIISLKNLQILDLQKCETLYIFDLSIRKFISLNLGGLSMIQSQHVLNLIKPSILTLNELYLQESNITSDILYELIQYLNNLNINYLDNLNVLDLSWCENIEPNILNLLLNKLRNIKSLSLRCLSLNEDILNTISNNCNKLEYLNFSRCSNNINDELLINIGQKCNNLKFIDLSWCILLTEDGILSFLEYQPNLQYLIIPGIKNITNNIIDILSNNINLGQKLKYISFSWINSISPNLAQLLSKNRINLLVSDYFGSKYMNNILVSEEY